MGQTRTRHSEQTQNKSSELPTERPLNTTAVELISHLKARSHVQPNTPENIFTMFCVSCSVLTGCISTALLVCPERVSE